MKVLFYTNIPSPYRVDFFNELGKYCQLTVLFELDSSSERNDAWRKYQFKNFTGIVMRGVRLRNDSAFCPEIIKYIQKKQYDKIVITQVGSLTSLMAVAYMRLKKIKYYYEGDGGFANKKRGVKAFLKKYIIAGAEKCFSPSKMFDDYCITYGAAKENIIRYPFTSVFDKDILDYPIDDKDKKRIKKELGIIEERMILAVGSFIHRKGFDILIRAMVGLPEEWGVYIVGDEATKEYLLMKNELRLNNLHFVGFRQLPELEQYYKAADLFVHPTREDIWGLVINEAMARGLPVITTDKCIAGMELIEFGVNGWIVNSDDSVALQKTLMKYVCNMQSCKNYNQNSLDIIRNYTIEKMVKAHNILYCE